MIQTWNTYKKKYNPRVMQVIDSVFNKPISVVPTLRNEGFKITTIEIDNNKNPMELVKNEIKISNIKADLIVYHTWVSRDGWKRFIDIGYK